ncbi:nitrate- and nitrite sensing domain-containing protein [Spongiactinospora sp. TRM90649]|uniref:sensor histidine kinase n=1 Tax=Spongiactinospora sp. TRM90649 TaxID=3031114 RepID=UPI0023F9BFF2|nr:nitrate- and nitrite sensing domain-containing protein [Spongiactinospora sp. TRM90649]MDF5754993.1 nitrate- and nitrite sensing domain-containing protein [Spongiactinospora sp. TRM90649]
MWTFAAASTMREGLELLRIGDLHDEIVAPTRALMTALQNERRGATAYLGASAEAARRAEVDGQRAATNTARSDLERRATAPGVQDGVPAVTRQRLRELLVTMDRLAEIRVRVDTRNFTPLQTIESYSTLVDAALRVFGRMRVSTDPELTDQSRAITLMEHGRELMSRETALLNGAMTEKKIDEAELAAFTTMVANRRLLQGMALDRLDGELRTPYEALQKSPAYTALETLENTVTTGVRPGEPLPAQSAGWIATTTAVSAMLDRLGDITGRVNGDNASALTLGLLTDLIVAGGLGLVAVAASIYVSVRFSREFGAELRGLQGAALDLAHHRLPDVVERLRRGETVPAAAPPPVPATATREIADVAAAFASVGSTAVQAAVGQAELRKGIAKVFLNLARRSQSLLQRQLDKLETMEKRATDPALLDDLFVLDHMTTRMRRHAEGLIILSGSAPGRGWRNPVSVYDVIRAAIEEVEDYPRVAIDASPQPAIVGTAVTDVVHLVAELVENATIFSPPHAQVLVRGHTAARGYALEVEDRGLGLTAPERAQINDRLAHPPEFDLADTDRLGLFVVGRLAARHNISVSLHQSPYGGTTAVILIPSPLLAGLPSTSHAPRSASPPTPRMTSPAQPTTPTRTPPPFAVPPTLPAPQTAPQTAAPPTANPPTGPHANIPPTAPRTAVPSVGVTPTGPPAVAPPALPPTAAPVPAAEPPGTVSSVAPGTALPHRTSTAPGSPATRPPMTSAHSPQPATGTGPYPRPPAVPMPPSYQPMSPPPLAPAPPPAATTGPPPSGPADRPRLPGALDGTTGAHRAPYAPDSPDHGNVYSTRPVVRPSSWPSPSTRPENPPTPTAHVSGAFGSPSSEGTMTPPRSPLPSSGSTTGSGPLPKRVRQATQFRPSSPLVDGPEAYPEPVEPPEALGTGSADVFASFRTGWQRAAEDDPT